MLDAVCDTSPLLYLYRIGVLDWLPRLFARILVPVAVVEELEVGYRQGYDVPSLRQLAWLEIVDPHSLPSEWLTADLGPGELATVALALENPTYILLLDDLLARQMAQAAGLNVMGTLGILLEARSQGLTECIRPLVGRLEEAGMWMSAELRQRILTLAGES